MSMPKGKTIAVFDFDGTITTKDTLLYFILFTRGYWAFMMGFFLYSPLLEGQASSFLILFWWYEL